MGIRLRISDHKEWDRNRYDLTYDERSVLDDVCAGWYCLDDAPVMWRLYFDRLFHDDMAHENCPPELVVIPDAGVPAWTLRVEVKAVIDRLTLDDEKVFDRLKRALAILDRQVAIEAAYARLDADIADLKQMGLDYQDLQRLFQLSLDKSEQS